MVALAASDETIIHISFGVAMVTLAWRFVIELIQMKAQRLEYLKSFWNFIDYS